MNARKALIAELVAEYGCNADWCAHVVGEKCQELRYGADPLYDAATDELSPLGATLIREDFAEFDWEAA